MKKTKLSIQRIMDKVGDEIKRVLDNVSEKDTMKFVKLISKSKRIFVLGSGRSGLVAEAFAMRLEQLGKEIHIIGEPTCPEVKKEDLLIVISGSGKTKYTNVVLKSLERKGTVVCLITANKKSEIARNSDLVIKIKGKTKAGGKSIEPLGSLFEQSVLVYLDSVVILLMKRLKKSEKFMKKKHSKTR